MEIFVRDADCLTEKWRSVLTIISFCLLRACLIMQRHVGRGFRMYEDTKWHNVISNLTYFFGVYIPIFYFDFLCIEY